ncbi:MAG: hypothetical protein ACE5K1_10595 [Acidiferrobacterales bacterium]
MQRRNRNDAIHLVLVVALAAIASFAGPVAQAKEAATPEFLTGATRPDSIALLPVRAEMIQRKMLSAEDMIKESEALEAWAAEYLAIFLKEKGYSVKALKVDQISADSELQELVLHANKRYDEEHQQLSRKPNRVKKRRYSAGDEAVELAGKLGVSAVVFARIQAVAQSAKTSWIPGGMATVILELSVTNGVTGDVEAYFSTVMVTSFKKITKAPKPTMKKLARKVAKKFPAADEVIEADGSTLKADLTKPKGEDEVITELETLLETESAEGSADSKPKK